MTELTHVKYGSFTKTTQCWKITKEGGMFLLLSDAIKYLDYQDKATLEPFLQLANMKGLIIPHMISHLPMNPHFLQKSENLGKNL